MLQCRLEIELQNVLCSKPDSFRFVGSSISIGGPGQPEQSSVKEESADDQSGEGSVVPESIAISLASTGYKTRPSYDK